MQTPHVMQVISSVSLSLALILPLPLLSVCVTTPIILWRAEF